MDETVIFAKLKSQHYSGLIFAFVFCGVGVAFAIFARNPILRFGGAFVACGFGYFFLRNLWEGVPKAATAILNAEGVIMRDGLIPWSEVAEAWFQPAGAVMMLCLKFRDPDKFFPSRSRAVDRFNDAFTFGDVQLPVQWSGRSPEHIRDFLRRFTKFRG